MIIARPVMQHRIDKSLQQSTHLHWRRTKSDKASSPSLEEQETLPQVWLLTALLYRQRVDPLPFQSAPDTHELAWHYLPTADKAVAT